MGTATSVEWAGEAAKLHYLGRNSILFSIVRNYFNISFKKFKFYK